MCRLYLQPTFPIQLRRHNACDHHSYQMGKNCHLREREERCTIHLDLGRKPVGCRCLALISEGRCKQDNHNYHGEHPYRIDPVNKNYLAAWRRAYQSSISIFRHVSG